MSEEVRVCQGTCMQTSLTAMGMTMHIDTAHPPLVYAQPSSLTSTWTLKYAVTVQSPPTQAYKHISNIMVGAVLNVHPFLQLWLACMLSITSWAQLAGLSSYTRATILRAMHSAVPRTISRTPCITSRTPWDADSTLQWCCHIVHSLPASRDTIFFLSASLDQDICSLELRRICIPAPATQRAVQHHLC